MREYISWHSYYLILRIVCDGSCSTCNGSSPGDCLSCNSPAILIDGSCISNDLFQSRLLILTACASTCNTCDPTNITSCTSCSHPYCLFENACVMNCPLWATANMITHTCDLPPCSPSSTLNFDIDGNNYLNDFQSVFTIVKYSQNSNLCV